MTEAPLSISFLAGLGDLQDDIVRSLVESWEKGLDDGYELACKVIEKLAEVSPDTKLADAAAGMRFAKGQQVSAAKGRPS